MFLDLAWLSPKLATLAAYCAKYHHILSIINLVEAGLIALISYLLWWYTYRSNKPKSGRWLLYIALAFAVFFTQYFIITLHNAYVAIPREQVVIAEATWLPTALLVLSAINNAMFIAAARALLLRTVVASTPWIILVASPMIVLLLPEGRSVAQLLDAVVAAVSLLFFGMAFALLSGGGMRARILGMTVALCCLTYAAVTIPYAWAVRAETSVKWDEFDVAVRRAYSPRESSLRHTLPDPGLGVKSLLVFASMFLKLGIAGGAVIHYLTHTVMPVFPRQALESLQELVEGRKDFLASDGVVKALASCLGARCVELHLLLPGSTKTGRVAVWCTAYPECHGRDKDFAVYSIYQENVGDGSTDSLVGSEGEHRVESELLITQIVTSGEDWDFARGRGGRRTANTCNAKFRFPVGEPLTAARAVPIWHGGGVIGCLLVGWHRQWSLNWSLVRLADLFAIWIGPILQSRRQSAAIVLCARRLRRHDINPKSATDIVYDATAIVHRFLCPLATGIIMDHGFVALTSIRSDRGHEEKACLPGKGSLHEAMVKVVGEGNPPDIQETRLVVPLSSGLRKNVDVGVMAVALRLGADTADRPSVASYPWLRIVIGHQVAEAMLDASKVFLGNILERLHARLAEKERPLDEAAWLAALQEAAAAAGLAWVVSGRADGGDMLGEKAVAERIVEDGRQWRWRTSQNGNARFARVDSVCRAHAVVELPLPPTSRLLWLGVERKRFGRELTYPSPWLAFLVRFADIARASLSHLLASREISRIQVEAARNQGLTEVAVTVATLVHQLSNMCAGLTSSAATFDDAFRSGRLLSTNGHDGNALPQLANEMRKLGERATSLTRGLLSIAAVDQRKPCAMADALDHVRRLHGPVIGIRGLQLDIRVPPDIMLNVPFSAAALTIGNLVGNSIDACERGGIVRIEAIVDNAHLQCDISDNGRGIDPLVRDRVFEMGASTKKERGAGWGLYLVHRSLRENGSSIELLHSPRSGMHTTFRIRFPLAPHEATS